MIKTFLPFWPQIFIITGMLFGFVKGFFLGGTVRTVTIGASTVLNLVVRLTIFWMALVCGGMFAHITIPVVIFTIFTVMVSFIAFKICYDKYGETVEGTVSNNNVTDIIAFGLVYWTGFFDSFFNFILQ